MLTSITPLGERGRNSRWGVTVSAFVIGSTLAGALAGRRCRAASARCSASFSLATSIDLLILIGAALIGAALDLGWEAPTCPSVARQVNEDWMRSYRGWVYGVGFGFQLGLGFLTVVSASAVYLALSGPHFEWIPRVRRADRSDVRLRPRRGHLRDRRRRHASRADRSGQGARAPPPADGGDGDRRPSRPRPGCSPVVVG